MNDYQKLIDECKHKNDYNSFAAITRLQRNNF
jgi:hypothetical protein